MTNEEGNSSHHAVYNQESEIRAEENEPTLDKAFQNLFYRATQLNYNYIFSPIFRVPSRLRDINPSSFTPRVVSIGPLHGGHPSLKSMENKKGSYLNELLTEVGSPEETLKNCVNKVRGYIEEIKKLYSDELDKKYTDDDLAEMMVMDACFILQFINSLKKSGNMLSDNRIRSRSIALDMVLLENQIPFFVLQDIYDLTLHKINSTKTDLNINLTTMLCDLLEHVNPFKKERLQVTNLSDENKITRFHIVSVLHELYQPGDKLTKISDIPTTPSAVELHKVGVRFRTNQSLSWQMGISFEKSSHKPTLKMPKVLIDNFFEVVMRNLIVYEQYSPVENYVTSYAMAMSMLAATPADVDKLAESNVLINHLGSNEKASNMISNICKDVTFLDFYYMDAWKKAKNHYDSYWSKNYGVLRRKYFSTPWKAIALFVAVILFIFAAVQFAFRIITFKSSRK